MEKSLTQSSPLRHRSLNTVHPLTGVDTVKMANLMEAEENVKCFEFGA